MKCENVIISMKNNFNLIILEMNENETSQQQNEQIKEQDEEDYDMSGTIIFSIFERHKY